MTRHFSHGLSLRLARQHYSPRADARTGRFAIIPRSHCEFGGTARFNLETDAIAVHLQIDLAQGKFFETGFSLQSPRSILY